MVTPGISRTKLCPVDGPIYSKVTYDKMSPSRDFVTFAYGEIFLFAIFFNLLVQL